MATKDPEHDFKRGEHARGEADRDIEEERLALGPPLPKKPYLSDVELRRDGDGRLMAILEKFKVTFGNRLTETPLDTRRRRIDWENERFPPEGEAWLHKSIQWTRIGEACPIPKFEWRQQREHTYMVPVSPRAKRLQYAIIKRTGHLRMEGTDVRTSIHVREAIGNRVSPWSNAIWFDVNAEGRLIDYGTTEVRLEEENGVREARGTTSMILKALHIANFKAFAIAQRAPLRPITLVYGVNSAGKSSILHALALAHHAVETGDLDTQRTRIGGDIIDLGGFRQYVHRRDRKKQVELRFELDPKQLSGRVAELLRSAEDIVVELVIGEGITSEQQDFFSAQVRENVVEDSCRVERFAVEVDGASLLSMSGRAGGLLRLDRLEHGHPVFRELFRGILMLATTTEDIGEDDFVMLGEVLDGLVPDITSRVRGLFPGIEEMSEGSESKGEGWDTFMSVSRGRRREDLSLASRTFVPKALRELVEGLGAAIEGDIRRLRYLGPLRSYPPRHLTFPQHHDPNWFAGGGYAWDVARKRGEVRRRVNAWLGDANRLQTNYELVVRDLLPSDLVASELSRRLDGELHDLLASVIARVADREQPDNQEVADDFDALFAIARDISRSGTELDFLDWGPFPEIQALLSAVTDTEELSQHLADLMVDAHPEEIQDLVLVDQRTDTPVSHRDVGIGVSQVLPVLVSAYASTDKLLAIEQPEIHLHPALQAELGDVFIESALGEGRNTFLIETHSEHLLLRIMRRMRETSTGKLPDGVPEVRPEDVMVLFVEPDGARSLIREMPLNERGELVKAWPGGFFEEGLREIF